MRSTRSLLLRHARFGWKSRSTIRAPQRACDTASGSGECARSRTPIVSGWRSSAAPAFRALVAGAHASRESVLWFERQPGIIEKRIVGRRVLPVRGDRARCRPAAMRRASLILSIESAMGADERARLGREPQPHEIHIARRAWSVRGGRGRFGAPATPWASSQASSQVVCIGVTPARLATPRL